MERNLWVNKERWDVDGEEKRCNNVAEIMYDDDGIKMIGVT